jgi:hypothetical protein
MSIAYNSPERNFNYLGCLGLSIALFSLCMIGIFLVMNGERTILVCAQLPGHEADCLQRQTWIGLWTYREVRFPRVLAAQVGEHCDSEGACTYRVEIRRPGGMIPLSEYYTVGKAAKQASAAEINRFILEGSPANMEFHIPGANRRGWLAFLVPLGFFVAGIMIFVFSGGAATRRPLSTVT